MIVEKNCIITLYYMISMKSTYDINFIFESVFQSSSKADSLTKKNQYPIPNFVLTR